MALRQDGPDYVYRLESGCLTLDASLPDGRRQISLVLYPGDVIAGSAVPPLSQIGLTATVPTVVLRRRVGESDSELIEDLSRAASRALLHSYMTGRLTGDERVATLLLELACKLGKPTAGGISFELPLSRADMADYLALNPDTLSRIVSRLRASGVITMLSRSRATAKDLAALEARTPLVAAVKALAVKV